jgi:hypothetical protein
MATPPLRVARVDKRELFDLPAAWTSRERGQYLRVLLSGKGIDPARLFRVEYHPRRHCWVLTQEEPPPGRHAFIPADSGKADETLFAEAMTLFRRTAQAAFAALAAQDRHFACFGREYQLPPAPQETTPADLAKLLGGPSPEAPPVSFTSEGGWQTPPSKN